MKDFSTELEVYHPHLTYFHKRSKYNKRRLTTPGVDEVSHKVSEIILTESSQQTSSSETSKKIGEIFSEAVSYNEFSNEYNNLVQTIREKFARKEYDAIFDDEKLRRAFILNHLLIRVLGYLNKLFIHHHPECPEGIEKLSQLLEEDIEIICLGAGTGTEVMSIYFSMKLQSKKRKPMFYLQDKRDYREHLQKLFEILDPDQNVISWEFTTEDVIGLGPKQTGVIGDALVENFGIGY
ncbi:hypothetical protein C1645_745215 [Glomus cerebriforme]|uniref:Uncharacterized protein n=1 Tax=Glomus cerebriforme TaxID=658196 RepID=A0A397S6W5_9GLOM|nr:hypothetical protein C1645_745215 [Glomus cerebriforme]